MRSGIEPQIGLATAEQQGCHAQKSRDSRVPRPMRRTCRRGRLDGFIIAHASNAIMSASVGATATRISRQGKPSSVFATAWLRA